MSREIKFRGKRVDNGELVCGYLVQTKDNTYICYAHQYDDDLFLSPKNIFIEVEPKTVGQYTDLLDKNGKEIYEGDVVSGPRGDYPVEFIDGSFCINDHSEGYWAIRGRNHWFNVIGNIYEHPHLMEEGGADGH